MTIERLTPGSGLQAFPPADKWDDWREYDAKAWPKKVEKRYLLVPTICFNCEAACGLLAFVDKDAMRVRKFEGNPLHPASRGHNCAKGPATINQIHDPERILYPLKRVGRARRGAVDARHLGRGAGRHRRPHPPRVPGGPAERGHVPRRTAGPRGRDGPRAEGVGVDGHNSHTNVCSAAARLGYALWSGYDRPCPDHANARFILLLSSHLETGHYFNPHAQRIIEGKLAGAKLAVMDPRLSNTASRADYWMPTYPGSEAAVLLAMARVLLDEGLADLEYLERWTNWREYMADRRPDAEPTFAGFLEALADEHRAYTPAFAEAESGVPRETIVDVARQIGAARGAFASHVWRGAAAGNEGGWQVARALQFLTVLTASVGTPGGTSPSAWNKFKPVFWEEPPPQKAWNELLFPQEWPLCHYEMSFLLPHFLKEGRGKLDTYFTRVYNPVWTNPDGMTWMQVLKDESLVGLHAALTPTWSETASFADYVLPMGMASERHDIQSQETHAGKWVSFRQPVLRAARERMGETFQYTYETNPGEVWEEDEFWIELSWRIDPDGALGIRKHFESPYRAGREADGRRVLPLDLRERGAGPAREGRGRGPDAARVHAEVRRVPDRVRHQRAPGEERRGRRQLDRSATRASCGRAASRSASIWRRGSGRGVADAVAPARDLLADDARLGLGRPGAARLHPQPRPPQQHRRGPRRDAAAADVPPADAHPHAQRATRSG